MCADDIQTRGLRVAIEDTVTALHPILWATLSDVQIGMQVFEGLLTYDRRLNIRGRLAQSWQASRSGKQWRFALRRGTEFHDGCTLDAQSAIWNLENVVLWRSRLLEHVESVQPDDRFAFTINLKHPVPSFLDKLASPASVMISPGTPPGLTSHSPVAGTGPFRFQANSAGRTVTLQRFAAFRGSSKSNDRLLRIEFVPLKNGPAMLQALQDDKVDLIYECPYAVIRNGNLNSGFVVRSCPSLSVNMLHFNLERGPFKDMQMRRLITSAIDKTELFELGNEALGYIAEGPISPASRFYTAPKAVPKSRRPISTHRKVTRYFELLASKDYGAAWLELFCRQLARAGVTCKVIKVPVSKLIERIAAGSYDAVLTGLAAGPDPDSLLFETFHSSGRTNISRIRNKGLDMVLERSKLEPNEEQRKKYYAHAIELINEIRSTVFLRHGLSIVVHSPMVTGVVPYPDNYLRLHKARIISERATR